MKAEEYRQLATKPKKRRKQPEAALQISVFKWLRKQYPTILALHIPNGGRRNKIEAAKLKRMGTLAGIPDIFVAMPVHPYAGFFCELKAGKNDLTTSQKEIHQRLKEIGYYVCEARSLEEFDKELWRYFYDPRIGQRSLESGYRITKNDDGTVTSNRFINCAKCGVQILWDEDHYCRHGEVK